jgi:hypothetical protein
MFCGYCGKENSSEHKFCTECGKSLTSEDISRKTRPESILEDTFTESQANKETDGKKRNKLLIILFFLVGLLFFLKLFFDHSIGIYFAGTGRLSNTLGQAVGYSITGLILPVFVFMVGKIFKKDWINGFAISSIILILLGLIVFISNQYKFWSNM